MLSDEELVACVRAGDDAALDELLLRHRHVARSKAASWFLVGGDQDDVVQEAMIGLYTAVRDFDPCAGASFRTFAELCVSSQLITAIRTATRLKHGPLNHAISLQRPALVGCDGDGDGDGDTLADLIPAPPSTDPAEHVLADERIEELREHVDGALSELEVEVFRLHVDGVRAGDIAARLKCGSKSIDNALQRVRRKLAAHLLDQRAEVA